MIGFEKHVSPALPYDRHSYLSYFDEDDDTVDRNIIWHAFSLQLAEIRNDQLYKAPEQTVVNCINHLEISFKKMISGIDQSLPWIVNHDDKDLPWFNEDGNTMPELRKLFKQNNVPLSFVGCLTFDRDDLLNLARELITYSYILSYKNLDISHGKLPLVVKFTGHLTLDLLSTDKALLTKILNDNAFDVFLKIPYRSS
jgi:hypothetical protein